MSTGNTRLLERLFADGLITAEAQEAALNLVARTGERVEEVILELKALDEAALLKYLAALHKTRFVSTEKLAKADIDRITLDKVPKKLAERDTVFPVLYDAQTATLSIVTPDPDNAPALHDVQLASGVKEVRAFVGRPRAVKAAISKAYNGDIHAFAILDRDAHAQFSTMLNVFERNLVSDESLVLSMAKEATQGERVLGEKDFKTRKTGSNSTGGVGDESFQELLNVLITLIENARPDLRGHSATVARLTKKIAERIGLPESTRNAYVCASYLHDLGKMGAYHLTTLNVAEYEGHRAQAEKQYKSPIRLLEAVQLPLEVTQTVESMYERYDGKGFPDSSSQKEIPLGARILAIADTYADLTQNPRNPFRKTLRPVQACEVLARYRGTVFDPNLVDLFKHTVTGEDVKARLLANRHRAMIIDPDPEETTVLELRLLEQGFEVAQAHTIEQALKHLEKGETELVIAELDLPPNGDGLALLAEIRKRPWGQKLPWVIVTGRTGRNDAAKAFELGAADYMAKPVSADLLVAKLKQIIEREAQRTGQARGVSGSLLEMGLPDMVQVLWHGRKSGSLKIRSGTDSGEIHFVNGAIFNALWTTLRGEEAFYAMLKLADGDFALDPNFVSPQQVIMDSPEALLLEGMRRMDEGTR
jgi:response regulator RpfG family c-di-GMP phosphodiesterase